MEKGRIINKKTVFSLILGAVVSIAAILVASMVGAKTIPLDAVLKSIFQAGEDLDSLLVHDSRLPRALCAMLVGGFLAMAGALLQGITRNPLAEPSIMGITQGATLAVAIASVNANIYGMFGSTVSALIGSTISGILVLAFSMQSARNMNLSRLLMAGTAMSTFFLSMASLVAMLGNRSQDLAFWVSGGFRTATWSYVWLVLIIGGICGICALIIAKKINVVSLGDDVAVGLGVNPNTVRIQAVAVLIPLCAVCVSVGGNIAFVGLIVPHVVRLMLGNDYRRLIPVSFFFGAALLSWADIAAKMVNIPYETPIGLFSSLIGIPIFLHLVRKENT